MACSHYRRFSITVINFYLEVLLFNPYHLTICIITCLMLAIPCGSSSSLQRGKDDAAAVIINSLCCVHTHSISKSLHATQLGNPKPSQPVQPVPLSTCGTPEPQNHWCFATDLTHRTLSTTWDLMIKDWFWHREEHNSTKVVFHF